MAALVIASIGALVTVVAVLWLILLGARKDGQAQRDSQPEDGGFRRRFP